MNNKSFILRHNTRNSPVIEVCVKAPVKFYSRRSKSTILHTFYVRGSAAIPVASTINCNFGLVLIQNPRNAPDVDHLNTLKLLSET